MFFSCTSIEQKSHIVMNGETRGSDKKRVRSLTIFMQPLLPFIAAGGDGAFHAADPFVELLKAMLESLGSPAGRVGIGVVEFPLLIVIDGASRRGFHDQG